MILNIDRHLSLRLISVLIYASDLYICIEGWDVTKKNI
jgi:hypothetical protein